MLVLTRRKNQAILIDNEITIKVLEVKGDTVKIGIEAPENINICRQEIYLDVQKENRKSSKTKGNLKALADILAEIKLTNH